MITETMENRRYVAFDTERNKVLCVIEDLGNDIYKAVNSFTQITAEIKVVDDYKTYIRCIENKKVGKDGRFRKNKTLADHNTRWLAYMLEEKGFIRKSKVTN